MVNRLLIEIVGDEKSYIRSAENTLRANQQLTASNTKLAGSYRQTAEVEVASALKAQEAQRARLIGLQRLSRTATDPKVAATATLLASQAEKDYARSLGLVATASGRASSASAKTERDLGKAFRGALAGSGIFHALGRSLAFASGGFLAIAGTATLLRQSVDAGIALAATQRQVDQQLRTSGKTWGQYGAQIDATDLKISHYSGFTNQDLLQSFGYLVRVSGNVQTALRLNAVAADVARGRHIALSSASLALGKALGGSVTALRRLGIVIPPGVKGMQALAFVQQKFAGQAKAGATIGDRFNATLVDSEEIIGTALLPTLTKYLTSLGEWLQKMNESGRLQKDVAGITHVMAEGFHDIGVVIGDLDKITGSFANTLKILIGLEVAKKIELLAIKWGLVTTAANAAAAAETRAAEAGAVGGAAGLAGAAGVGGAAAGAARVARYGKEAEEIGAVGGAATTATAEVGGLSAALAGLAASPAIIIPIALALSTSGPANQARNSLKSKLGPLGFLFSGPADIARSIKDNIQRQNTYVQSLLGIPQGGNPPPFSRSLRGANPTLTPGFFPRDLRRMGGRPPTGFLAGVRPIPQWAAFQLTLTEQIQQTQAQMTKSTKDDVAVAKRILARIKRILDKGNLTNKARLQALQAEAQAMSVIQGAEADAAAKRAAAAQKAKAAAESYTIPMYLQVAQARAELTQSTADDIKVAKEIIAAAQKTLASGKKHGAGLIAVLNTIRDARAALQQQDTTYTLPARLQLQLARAQARGQPITAVLLRMRAALEKALKAAKGNIQKQTDIYNQIYGINQQLNSDAASALGDFKQASTKALTAGLGLSAANQRKLRARLSQLGPHGTVPGTGVGAAGYQISGSSNRPIHIHVHHTTKLDGKVVARNTTVHQQRHRVRNPPQHRGPHAGEAAA